MSTTPANAAAYPASNTSGQATVAMIARQAIVNAQQAIPAECGAGGLAEPAERQETTPAICKRFRPAQASLAGRGRQRAPLSCGPPDCGTQNNRKPFIAND